MAEAESFLPAKLICGIISSQENFAQTAKVKLAQLFGSIDSESPHFLFDYTDYYDEQMGSPLQRQFLSFQPLLPPERLSEIKIQTNKLEEDIRQELGESLRAVNIDPGFLNGSSLIMATAKNFAHRIPLQAGIYAHLELLFGKDYVRTLMWTYPDFKKGTYHEYFLEVRKIYLSQLKLG